MKHIKLLMIILLLFSLMGCSNTSKKDTFTIAVSILPQVEYVKSVVGDEANVVTVIPPGYSPANYEPTPKQLTEFSKADVYFAIGVGAEASILPKLKEINKGLQVVELYKTIGEVYPDRFFEEEEDENHQEEHEEENHNHSGRDPHIWMSPKRVKLLVEEIKKALITMNPDQQNLYEENANTYIQSIDEVDGMIKEALSNVKKRSFIIYHPSLGYFAEDYQLDMITIEESGKEATAKHLDKVLTLAKEKEIKVVFYQEEFDSTQAKTLAKHLGGEAVKLDILSPHYIENMKKIARSFKEVLEQ